MNCRWEGRPFAEITTESNNIEQNVEDEKESESIVKNYCSFDYLQLKETLLRGIYANGYEKPSTIQQRALLPCIRGLDVIIQAQSGSGKLTTFAIAILQRIDASLDECQTLILAPTRTKALQIRSVLSALGSYMDVRMHTCLGGKSLLEDIRAIESSCHIIIGTPGRVCDLVLRGCLLTAYVKLIVFCQADEMMALGLKPKLNYVFRTLPRNVQVIISSATLAQDVLFVSKCFMRNPLHIEVKKDELSLDCVRQYFVNVRREEYKLTTICDLYDTLSISQSVIFCNERNQADELAKDMTCNNFTVATVTSEMERHTRDKIIKNFRQGSYRVLIATDLLARNIDVQQSALVINYDLPFFKGDYFYRIGRSGRCRRKSLAINLVTDSDLPMLREIEQLYDTTIEEMPENIADIL